MAEQEAAPQPGSVQEALANLTKSVEGVTNAVNAFTEHRDKGPALSEAVVEARKEVTQAEEGVKTAEKAVKDQESDVQAARAMVGTAVQGMIDAARAIPDAL